MRPINTLHTRVRIGHAPRLEAILKRFAVLSFVVCALGLSLSCTPIQLQIQPPSIDVEGRVTGVDGTGRAAPDFVQTVRNDNAGVLPRLAYARSASIQNVRGLKLTAVASTGLPMPEEWHSLHISGLSQQPGADPVIREFSADRGWVRSHVGDLAWITIRKNDVSLPSGSFSNFPPGALRASGSTIVARVEEDDAFLPWTNTAGCGVVSNVPFAVSIRRLANAAGVDCFDMQTLASLLLNNLAIAVTGAAHDNNARALRHRLSVVPHVPSVPSAPLPGRAAIPPAPGFAFVYEADLEPIVLGQPVGWFTGTFTVAVPLTLSFVRGGANSFFIALDPIAPIAGSAPRVNDTRITVFADHGSIAASMAPSIRTAIVSAVNAAPLPLGPAGIPFTSFLELFFNAELIDNRALPADFSILALPENRAVTNPFRNTALRLGTITVTDLVPVPPAPLPGGLGAQLVAAVGPASTRVTVNRNAAGTSIRVFVIPPPTEVLAFRLVLLR